MKTLNRIMNEVGEEVIDAIDHGQALLSAARRLTDDAGLLAVLHEINFVFERAGGAAESLRSAIDIKGGDAGAD